MKKANFSLWCDFIERDFLESQFKELIKNGIIQGATSNPSIFANAILSSNAYKNDILSMKNSKLHAKDIYENLAFCDIKLAANNLLPMWNLDKNNGFISIEIDPNLCNDAPKSIDEGRRIFRTINMPNVMIKVPATNAGFEIMEALYKSGININATLVFSINQTKSCLEAFGKNYTKDSPKAVISVFVSRFDREIEAQNKSQDPTPKLGIYNATKSYYAIEEFDNPHIRTLFASTGIKDTFIDASYYVRELAFKNSINTAPLDTIKASLQDKMLRENGESKTPQNLETLESYLARFDVDFMAQKLLDSGLKAFIESFEKILKAI